MENIFKIVGTIAINNDSAIKTINETTKTAESSSKNISTSFKKVESSVDDAMDTDSTKKFEDALEDTGDETDNFRDKIGQTTKESEGFDTSLKDGIGTFAKWATAAITAITGVAAAFGAMSIKSADSLKKAMGDFTAETGIATESLGEYEGALKNIYKNNYGESFEDIANAMAKVKQQAGDIGADELEKMTTDAIVLRDTFEFEVNESMRAAKMLMDQFGLSGTEAYNLIAQGAQDGLDKNGDLLDSINEYSVHFKQLGLGAEDMFNMLSNGAEAGTFSVDKLGDAIKEFGIRVKDGSDTSASAFEYLGYDADKLFATFNKGGEEAAIMTKTLIDELSAMPDSVEKTTAGVALFGTMWEDLGNEGIKALSELDGGITTTKDALSSINEVKYDSFGDMLSGVKRYLETSLFMPIGQKIIPVIQKLVPVFTSVFDKILPPVLAFADELFPVWSDLIDEMLPIALGLFNQFLPVIKDLFGMMKPYMEEFQKIGMELFQNILMTFLPIVTDMLTRIMPILAKLSMVWLKLQNILVNLVMNVFLKLVDMIMPLVIDLLEPILEMLVPLMELVGVLLELLMPIFDLVLAILDPLVKLIGVILVPLVEILTVLIKGVLWVLTPLIEGLVEILSVVLYAAIEGINLLIEECADGFVEAWEWIKDTWAKAGPFFSEIWTGIKKTFGKVADWFGDTFKKAWQRVKDVFSTGSKIFTGIKEGITSVFKTVVNGLIGGINKIIAVPFKNINTMLNKIRDISIVGIKPFNFIKKDYLSTPEIPLLETGGVLEKGQIGLLEGNGAEAVVPLEKNQKWISKVADGFADEIGMGGSEQIVKKLDELIKAIYEMKIYLNSDAIVGELAGPMDVALAGIYAGKGRGR